MLEVSRGDFSDVTDSEVTMENSEKKDRHESLRITDTDQDLSSSMMPVMLKNHCALGVVWKNVSVTRGEKRILKSCSGSLQGGRMMALMGSSGSGKTTFLSCLRHGIHFDGEVRYGGALFCKEMQQYIGFLEQDDVVFPELTVFETLLFYAELRHGIGSKEARSKVDEVIVMMRLVKVADSQVGSPISGGERKRLCLARELLREPRLLFCDEPTSGLDSTMANQVISALRELCDTGEVTILACIHQPSTQILDNFDDLMMLREGEHLYYGPLQAAEALLASYGPLDALSRKPCSSL